MTHFNVHLEYRERQDALRSPEEALSELLELLTDFHASVGFSARGWLSVRLSVPAESVDQAFRIGTLVAGDALHRAQFVDGLGDAPELLVAEILTEDEFTAREGFEQLPELVGVAEAAKILGVSPQRIRQMIDEGKFTTATRVGERSWVLAMQELARHSKRADFAIAR